MRYILELDEKQYQELVELLDKEIANCRRGFCHNLLLLYGGVRNQLIEWHDHITTTFKGK